MRRGRENKKTKPDKLRRGLTRDAFAYEVSERGGRIYPDAVKTSLRLN